MDCQSLALALQDLSTSIQELATDPSSFVLHRTQCLCLAKSFALAVQHVTQQVHHFLSTCSFDSGAHQDLLPSLSELHHTTLQGHKFMRDCLFQDGWVKKSLVLALSTEAQDECLHDLVWCLCVIHQALDLLALQEDEEPGDDVYGTLNGIWAETSDEEDLRVLLDALRNQIASWKLQLLDSDLSTSFRRGVHAQRRLAEFLVHKLTRENDVKKAGAPCDDALPPCLWVDPLEISIKEVIGGGASAVIHEVEWHGETFGQKEFFGVDEALFAREAAIQARLRHPNLLQLIGCTSKPSRNQCGLVMELMDMDLRKMIEDRKKSGFDPPFSQLTSVDLMLQIAKGMEHLHSLHIMHRDLKSPNLLVTRKVPMDKTSTDCRVRVKIADFGMSKAKNQSSMFTTLKTGTTYWMAPEVFDVSPESESAKYTKKADVYSFAMVCYEILSGNVPFDDGRKRAELHQRLLRGERPKLPSSCPPYLANYIEKCWEGDPNKRPSFDQVSRTFRHLKGILLSSANPLTSSVLSAKCLTLIEDNLERAIGVNWPITASKGFTTKLMTISFEMSWYKVMECKLTNQAIVDDNLERAIGVNWPITASEWFMAKLRNISATGMLRSWWSSSAPKNLGTLCKTRGFFSTLVHCFDPSFRCLRRGPEMANAQWLERWTHVELAKATNNFATTPFTWQGPEMANAPCLKQYTHAELAKATNNFATTPFTRQGGFGKVFKGTLSDGQVVAVKVMSTRSSSANVNRGKGDEFLTELKMLGSIRHHNIVTLFGFCSHKGLLMLVYKFMPRGDLGHILHEWGRGMVLTCAQRYVVARGVAEALSYLHSLQIVHRDVKSSNILLDHNFNACLADFGIATFLADNVSMMVSLRGTRPYMAPEYMMTCQLGPEADVYSFGVVMLELASGRLIVDGLPLVQYVGELYEQGRLLDAVDERVRAECRDDDDVEDGMNRLLLVGLACCQGNIRDRPTMLEVNRILSKEAKAPTPARADRRN